MKLKWEDSLAIAITLNDTYPDVKPEAVVLADVHRWVCALREFDDDPDRYDEAVLEAIKMAWIEEKESL